MKPAYFQHESNPRDRWMISYLDVLTILLIFFVAIAAKGLPVATPAAAAPVPSKPIVTETRTALMQAEDKLVKEGLEVRLETRGLVISLPQAILFPSGEDQIGMDALPVVEKIAAVLHDLPNRVSLIGHADSVPIHNRRFTNNWELSAARGLKLLDVLSGKFGIPESRLSVASDGSYSPKGSNDTPDGRAINRRVEIVILDETP